MKISIIIPAHNEAVTIVDTIQQLERSLTLEHEVVVVNDHSSDNTAEVVKELSKEFNNVALIDNNKEAGFANAIRAGLNVASGDLIVPVMADLCDEPETINKMYDKIKEGFDVVCGSRYMFGGKKIGGPKLKDFFSRFVGISLHLFIKIPTHDIANSFKMYKKSVIDAIKIESKGFEVSVELPLKAFFRGFKITELPTAWTDRRGGESKFKILKQGKGYLKLYFWALFKGNLCQKEK